MMTLIVALTIAFIFNMSHEAKVPTSYSTSTVTVPTDHIAQRKMEVRERKTDAPKEEKNRSQIAQSVTHSTHNEYGASERGRMQLHTIVQLHDSLIEIQSSTIVVPSIQ